MYLSGSIFVINKRMDSSQRAIPVTFYPRREEFLNVISHLLGFMMSIAGLAVLVTLASLYGSVWHVVSFSIFGSSMILLYLASTLYHAASRKSVRKKLNVFDHSAIYVLIAGTYTPFCLVALNGVTGWVLFGITWGLAFAGVSIKLFLTGRYDRISTVGYVLMGWVAVFAARPLVMNLPPDSLAWLLAGGVSYTIGALFYSLKKLPYNHAIFHIWVLLGSIFHFISILYLL